MNHEKIKEGVRLLLEGIGEDVDREGLQETPERIARMCEQIFGGLNEDASVHLNKQFHAAGERACSSNHSLIMRSSMTSSKKGV